VKLSAVFLGLAAVGAGVLVYRWPPGAAVIAGAALAVIAARHWNQVVRHTEPLRGFVRAALPLLLPLVVVGAAGAIAFRWWAQLLIVFGLGVFAWRVIVAPEWRPALEALATRLSKPLAAPFWTLGIPILAAVTVFFVLIRPGAGPFEDRGGLVLLYATIPLWIEAVALRALGYATSWLRVAIGLLLIAVVARGAAALGIIPGGDWLDANLAWLATRNLAIALAALLLLAVVGPGAWSAAEPARAERLRPFAALGLVAAIFAALILGGAALDGAISARAHTAQRVDSGRPAGKPVPAEKVAPAAGLNGRQLAARYAPELVLAKGEQWRPIPVDSFVADAKLYNRAGRLVPHPNPLPDHCPGPKNAGCFKLVLPNCDSGEDKCAQGYAPDPAHPQGTAYFRVLREQTKHGSYAFAGNDRFTDGAARDTSILIQYWFFYRYDEWKRPILSGTLTQRHQADWEAVTIGLSDAATPVFLGYSEHCGGTWRNWNQIETAPGSPLHPLVAVALGSHANYVSSDERRSPNWASCGGGLPRGFLTLLSYASNIRDETSFGTDIPYRDLNLIRASVREPPMSFPGTWGANDSTTLVNERTQVLKQGSAPATPTYQPLWQDPLATIFCGANWSPPSGDNGGRCKTPVPTG
jgi:hypothetical protein